MHLNVMARSHAVTQEQVENMDMCFHICRRWIFQRILTQMFKIILDLYRAIP